MYKINEEVNFNVGASAAKVRMNGTEQMTDCAKT